MPKIFQYEFKDTLELSLNHQVLLADENYVFVEEGPAEEGIFRLLILNPGNYVPDGYYYVCPCGTGFLYMTEAT